MMENNQLVIIAGGNSPEHDVSLLSAHNLKALVQPEFPNAKLVILGRDGSVYGQESSATSDPTDHTQYTEPSSGSLVECLQLRAGNITVFPLIHGTTGEDGTLQGFLEMCKIPYIGCGVRASAVCMDKELFKIVIAANASYGFKQTRYIICRKREWATDQAALRERIKREQMSWPLIIKPASLGSSIGLAKVESLEQLESAVSLALRLDSKIIVEEAVESLCEFEIGIIGNESDDSLSVSPIAKIVNKSNLVDYHSKYFSADSSTNILSNEHAPLSGERESLRQRIEKQALDAYRIMECRDLARVDFLYDLKSGELYLNEINTLPGMTQTSIFLKLWEANGMSAGEVVKILIASAQVPSR